MTIPSHIGQYRILRKIGAGGMGVVYLGEHILLGRRAAIKTLLTAVAASREIVERFFNEARATSAIADPGVIQVFDFGYHVDGTAYIVMELLEGEALSARLGRLGRLALGDALRFARQIAGSLAAAHARGIIHRDLKPENIFLVRDAEAQGGERTKIIDFGVCKVGAGDPTLAEAGVVIGTPLYMSPEQCRGMGDVDPRSDIYAFGCLVFHLITGRPPFVCDAADDLMLAHLQAEPPAAGECVSGLPRAIDVLLRRCLAKSPDDRFASMTAVQAALGELAAPCDGAGPELAAPPPIVPLGQGFRSVYDANLAARFAALPAGSPMSPALLERLRFASTLPLAADDELPPWRAGGRAALACVVVAGVVLGLIVTPLVLGGDDPRAAARAPRPAPPMEAAPVASPARPAADAAGGAAVSANDPPASAGGMAGPGAGAGAAAASAVAPAAARTAGSSEQPRSAGPPRGSRKPRASTAVPGPREHRDAEPPAPASEIRTPAAATSPAEATAAVLSRVSSPPEPPARPSPAPSPTIEDLYDTR